jgi:hypothetical protein
VSDLSKCDALLSKSDLVMARDEIADMHRMLNTMASKEGGQYIFKTEYVEAWNAFRDDPRFENAKALLEIAPHLLEYFEMCSPGTKFYSTAKLLKKKN